jgi:phosphohistidine phosphatase SixA
MRPSFRLTASAIFAALITTMPVTTQAQDMSAEDLIAAMQEGGHVIFIRHATTEVDYADQVDAEMGDCSTQRTLSEGGWDEAKNIGAAFELYDIPVGDVISSQYCRAWQTADLAFGRYNKTSDLNFEPSEDYTEEQIATMRDNVIPHLSTVPSEGNTVLVGHDDPFEAATGIYPEPMGVTFVILPGGDGSFEVLGHIPLDGWDVLGG